MRYYSRQETDERPDDYERPAPPSWAPVDPVDVDPADTLRRVLLEGELRGEWEASDFTRGQRSGLIVAICTLTGDTRDEVKADLAAAVGEGMSVGAAIAEFHGTGVSNVIAWPSVYRDFKRTLAAVADPNLTHEQKQQRIRDLADDRDGAA